MKLDGQLRGVARDCLARKTRALSRAITGLYQEALHPHGLLVSQFNVLVAIAVLGEASPGDLVDGLHLEKSTVSRNARRLGEQGWVAARGRGRGVLYSVTDAGRELLAAAVPDWRRAQRRARRLVGGAGAQALDTLCARVLRAS